MSAPDPGSRTARVRAIARREGCGALLVSNPVSARYLIGVPDVRWALIGPKGAAAMPFDLSHAQVLEEAPPEWRVLDPSAADGALVRVVRRWKVARIAYESSTTVVDRYEAVRRALSGVAELVGGRIVERAREVKDAEERDRLEGAGRVTAEIARQLPWLVRRGMSERALACEIDARMLRAGAQGPAFETIVLFGARTALPHGRPTERRLRRGDLCLVDFGARCRDYCSDVTRVFACGSSTARQRATYRRVVRAYEAGRGALQPGLSASIPDLVARRSLGPLASRFCHSLGHGIGLEIHEGPRLAASSTGRLRRGEAVTVEPGVYLPGWGGIRLEDSFLIGAGGPRSLTGAPAADLPSVSG